MPCLLLRRRALVKTVRFADPAYVGDPVNTVTIFNDMEVDELILLDIAATPEGAGPQKRLLAELASKCFMPFTYGGGLRRIEDVQEVFALGAEKIALNTAAGEDPGFVRACAERFGSQSVVVSIDARARPGGGHEVFLRGGRAATGRDPLSYAREMEALGAGEILLTSIDRDGTFSGYDLDLVAAVSAAVGIPVIACGGAAAVGDFVRAVKEAGASAVAAGSMVVYQGPHRAVLVNFPPRAELERALG